MTLTKWLVPMMGAVTLGFAVPAQATPLSMMDAVKGGASDHDAAQPAHYRYPYRYYRYYDEHPRYYRYYSGPRRYYRRHSPF